MERHSSYVPKERDFINLQAEVMVKHFVAFFKDLLHIKFGLLVVLLCLILTYVVQLPPLVTMGFAKWHPDTWGNVISVLIYIAGVFFWCGFVVQDTEYHISQLTSVRYIGNHGLFSLILLIAGNLLVFAFPLVFGTSVPSWVVGVCIVLQLGIYLVKDQPDLGKDTFYPISSYTLALLGIWMLAFS